MMNAPGTETPLRDLETAPRPKNHMIDRQSHVGETDFAVTGWFVVAMEYRQHPFDLDAGGIDRTDHHRVTLMRRRRRLAQTHEDHDAAMRMTDAGGPPFA